MTAVEHGHLCLTVPLPLQQKTILKSSCERFAEFQKMNQALFMIGMHNESCIVTFK